MADRVVLLRHRPDCHVKTQLDTTRHDWEDGHRRFERALRDPAQAERLEQQFDLISAELRRRVGGTFTLSMLADAYGGVDAWALQLVEEHAPSPGWSRTVSMVGDAAFHVYARAAVDYAP